MTVVSVAKFNCEQETRDNVVIIIMKIIIIIMITLIIKTVTKK